MSSVSFTTRTWAALLLSSSASLAQNVFEPDPAWRSGPAEETLSVALGDVDGDGDLDLVCGNFEESNSLYLNEGGTLARTPAWSSPSAEPTYAVALGDLDADGDLDLVCGNYGESNTLYMNENGTFSPRSSSFPMGHTRSVALGDMDADGDLDLVCGNFGERSTLFLNEAGTIASSPAWSSDAGAFTSSVALGDVDGDGDLDLVCGNYDERNTLYKNEGGSLATTPAWSSDAAELTSSVALGDVDGDGDLDLVCGNSGESTLYRNEGGVFATSAAWFSAPAEPTASVALGDVDGDGDLDLVCGNLWENDASHVRNTLYVNDGGTFAATPAWFSTSTERTRSVALGDVDGDGNLDLVCGNYRESNTLYLNEGGSFAMTPVWSSSSGAATVAVALGDVEGDGDLDLVCGNFGESSTLYANEGGTFTGASSTLPAQQTRSVALGDVDGDGDLDLVCGNYGERSMLHVSDAGSFATTPAWSSEATQLTASVALGDVDGDGDLDLVCGNYGERSTLYVNEGGSFATTPAWSSSLQARTFAVALGDVDGDGDLDLVSGNFQERNTLYLNEGGIFGTTPAWSSAPAEWTYAVALGDVDEDGDLDLVSGNSGESNTLYVNEGGNFGRTPAWSSSREAATTSLALGDVDGDGDLDLICGNYRESNTLFVNEDGTLATTPVASSSPAEPTYAIALGDVDGDGDLDLVRGNVSHSNTLYAGHRSPVYKGDPAAPTNHLPNNGAHLRHVSLLQPAPNLRRLRFRAIDVESDPVWVRSEFQYEGVPVWDGLDVPGHDDLVGPLASSPTGVEHQFDWDITRVPFDGRDVVVRLRAISHPTKAGAIQHVPSYNLDVGRIAPSRPEIRSSDDFIIFPTATVGDTVSVPLALRNNGTETLIVTDAALRLSRPFPFDLASGVADTLTVFLEPLAEIGTPEDLRIASNDPVTPTLSIPITADVRALAVVTNAQTESGVAPLGEALTIHVVPGDGVHVERGALFHRSALAGGPFTRRELVRSGGAFISVIPGQEVTEGGLDYWVEVENSGVFAFDPFGAPDDSLFFQAVASPTAVEATFVATASPTEGRTVIVQVQLREGTDLVGGVLHHRRGGETEYQSVDLEAIGLLLTGTIPGEAVGPRGIEYWVAVETATSRLTDPRTDPDSSPFRQQIRVLDLPEENASPGGRYRMFSIPLELAADFQGSIETLLSDQPEFGTYDPLRWRTFRWDAAAGASVELSHAEVGRFRPRPGAGYWLVSRDAHRIDTAPVEGLSTSTGGPVAVVLEPGWNQLGNPFAFAVARDALIRSSDAVGEPVAFDPSLGTIGDYLDEPPDVLTPFGAYFIKNHAAKAETLCVPPLEAAPPAAREPEDDEPAGWRLRLRARTFETESGSILLGVDPRAREEYDPLDRERPPLAPGPWVSVALANQEWKERPGLYRRDLRNSGGEGHTWDVEILTEEPGQVTITGTWETPPPGLAMRWIDREQSVSRDAREDLAYEIVSFGPERPYRLTLLIGSEEFVAREGDALAQVPIALMLDQNAPNPCRPSTRIRFGLPERSAVRLAVYDVAGREIAQLVDGRLHPAGFHAVVWNGADRSGSRVAPGVYFYRLETDFGTKSRKLLVLR
jgi:hypothetical protein